MREKQQRDHVSQTANGVEDAGSDTVAELSSVERRNALASLAKFAKYTGPGIALLLASEQAAASGGFKPE